MSYVAIVGSREFSDEEAVRVYVRALPKDTTVVSGGARGVDSWAANEARKIGLALVIVTADWKKLGKKAGFVRNKEIVRLADRVVAFWDQKSRGTQHTIKLTVDAGKPLVVFG